MRHLIAYNFKFSPGDDNHVYVSSSTEAEIHIDYSVEDYIDYHIKGPGYHINDTKIIYAYSPEIPGACVVYLYYNQKKDSKFARLLHVCYVYKEDSPSFNLPLLRHKVSTEQLFIPVFNKEFSNLTDKLYTLHGKEQYTELPWE